MALLAGHGRMLAYQGELRKIMVETNVLSPVRVTVTLLAPLAKLAFMRVLFLVARHAVRRELVFVEVAGMTGVAFRLLMRAM